MLISFAWFTCGAKVLWNGYCGCILLSTPLAFQKKKYILCLLYLKLFVTSKCKLEGTGIVEVCPFWHVLSCIFIVYLSVMSPFVIIVISKFFFPVFGSGNIFAIKYYYLKEFSVDHFSDSSLVCLWNSWQKHT